MKNILVIKKTDDAVRPLSPQPDPSKASTSVQEESEETRPSTSELDSTPDSDNSVSSKIQKTNQPRKKKIYSQKYKAEWEQHENFKNWVQKLVCNKG
ncbi:unnamed protein product [Acanthoscelides obtectus]|uniref:Uncharacterized protein n=1 Tax=Acanthoscelides obtectus TaxID=200917 RepID=A0A9P0JZM2_ACAOB|nr:unnamed protein product [Acanthoscelides obtectus]CAK1628006.1 hypothetical protein AOBTE_LOCUS4953 [Acanthoscelides obtectus]